MNILTPLAQIGVCISFLLFVLFFLLIAAAFASINRCQREEKRKQEHLKITGHSGTRVVNPAPGQPLWQISFAYEVCLDCGEIFQTL